MRLLLLSNSTLPGEPYLEWAGPHIDRFLGDVREALFVPYAAVTMDYDEYALRVREALAPRGIRVNGIHETLDAVAAVEDCEAVLVGGGNTFRLLERLQVLGLVEPLQRRVRAGLPYVGWSAGANVACPRLCTTNDMPIVEPRTFSALGLVRFQLNPHFTEATVPGHGGESRVDRLQEFTALNPAVPVVGLREGDFIELDGDHCRLGGAGMAEIFTGSEHRQLPPGSDLGFLLRR